MDPSLFNLFACVGKDQVGGWVGGGCVSARWLRDG